MTKLAEARTRLAAEWASARPSSSAEIAEFYRTAEHIHEDLEAWHGTASRQAKTDAIVAIAAQINARSIVDVGCGLGHDLVALRHADPQRDLVGVEPNDAMRAAVEVDGFRVCADVEHLPDLAPADLVLLVDVLEHIPDPERWLERLASRMRAGGARPGAVLIESTSVGDVELPLHLAENRTWHPGRILEHLGFQMIAKAAGLRVWQRSRSARQANAAALILCAYRTITVPTFGCVQALTDRPGNAWRVMTKTGDGLISRARSVVASRWLLETDDDVFLMVDDDITFLPEVAERIVQLCRDGLDIVCAAYPVRDGRSVVVRGLDTSQEFGFGPGEPPVEIRFAGTGFLAVHRRVLEVLARTLTFCHEDTTWAFWPFFMPMLAEIDGRSTFYLSEDWAFCERARAAGFHVWLDPSVRIGHLATLELNIGNMEQVAKAVAEGFDN